MKTKKLREDACLHEPEREPDGLDERCKVVGSLDFDAASKINQSIAFTVCG